MLFNLHRAIATQARIVLVVEGFFDTIAVHQAGYANVVALMGSTLSWQQAELLHTHFDRVLLMLDGDRAGPEGTATIARVLAWRMPIAWTRLADDKQPDSLPAAAIRHLLAGPLAGVGEDAVHS